MRELSGWQQVTAAIMAGHSYTLTLTNMSQTACNLGGVPNVVLLNSSGSPLPTHATGGTGTPRAIVVQPGDSARATARFSPDVPGPGDSQSGTCQPTAHTLRVAPGGGGTVDALIKPPTNVCEQGTLDFTSGGF